MAANRGEIAIRIIRAAQEMGSKAVAIYSYEDRHNLHRSKADESYMLSSAKSPVAAYLDIPTIVSIAKEHGVQAIHPRATVSCPRIPTSRRLWRMPALPSSAPPWTTSA